MKYDAATITSLYLFGQEKAPQGDELLDDKWIDRNEIIEKKWSNADFHEYMTTGPGRFANASQIALVQDFFAYSIPADLLGTSKEFSFSDAINFFGLGDQINEYTRSQNHELTQSDFKGNGGQEWAERAYVFQSQSYALNQNVKFYIDEYGNKFIKNFALMLHTEDFDFQSSSLGTQIGNFLIGDDIDPFEIGKTIKFVYPTSTSTYHEEYGSTYGIEQFNNDLVRYNQQNHGSYVELKAPMYDLVDKLWDSGITKFVDSKGRAIVYGANGSDSIDASPNLLNLPSNPYPKNSKMYKYYEENFHKGLALLGGDGSDTLIGSNFNDLLIGGHSKKQTDAFTDYLYGGEGNDAYISGDSDHIMDSDGSGSVYFEGKLLTGGKKKAGAGCGPSEDDGSSEYYGDGGVYRLSGNTLTFTKDGKILTIEDYSNKQLGISLDDNDGGGGGCPPPGPGGSGGCPPAINPLFNFHFSLPTPTRSVGGGGGGGGGGIYYGGGGGGGYYYGSSTPHTTPTPPTPKVECINYPNYNSAGAGGGGGGTGPIVLDLNRNGITSISLAASTALFDYDGDGVKENTAWIEGADALLVNDVNNDGIINNASELFGNYTKNSDGSIAKSGYQALSYYDTNHDGAVDATDTRFEELKLWIDSNQDGMSDEGELHTLTEMGVTSLTLSDPTKPYAPTVENTNTIIQETTFTDGAGEGILRDVLFRYENTSTNTDGVYFDMDGNGIKEKMLTWTEPKQWMVVKDLNGDGIINSGREVVGNQMLLSNGTKAADTIQALKTFDINHDGVIDASDNSGLAFWTDRNHNGLTDVGELEALSAAGAIQTIKLNPYQTLLSGYDNGDGVINNGDTVSNYLYIQTNSDDSVTLYLPDNAQAKAMIAGYTGGESIQTSQGEKIIKSVQFYAGYEMDLNDTLEGTDASETLSGSSRGETLRGKGGRDILDAGAGDDTLEGGADSDKLLGGAGNDTYVFNRGDGKDLIIDSSGTDTIKFATGITRDDIIIKSNGVDISIYLKDGTKALSQLTDQIIIKDWYSTGMVESITFSDGTSMDVRDMIASFSSDKNDTVYGTDNSEILVGGKGNDLLIGKGGSDTYMFNRGDGKDTIIDSAGNDTLELGAGITKDDLMAKKVGNDVIIGIRESGKIFDQLSDTITLKDWYSGDKRLERIALADGSTLDTNGIIELLGNIDDVITGTGASETFSTLGGNDTVYAGAGNDTLIGGKGDDLLQGGLDNDTYIFNRGDGRDTIIESYKQYYGSSDTLKFGEGIAKEDLVIQLNGYDLIVGIKEEGKAFSELTNTITVKSWRINEYRIESFVFSDGSGMNVSDIALLQMPTEGNDNLVFQGYWSNDNLLSAKDGTPIYGLGGNDTITTSSGNDLIYGGSGNDTINSDDGNDTVYGEEGNDYIEAYWGNNSLDGGAGNDTIFDYDGNDVIHGGDGDDTIDDFSGNDVIEGGKGNDTIRAGDGNDTYIYNIGDGVDTIQNAYFGASYYDGGDTLKFGEGITKESLTFTISGNDLSITFNRSENDKITIKNWLDISIDQFEFADGSKLMASEVAQFMAGDANNTIIGSTLNDTIDAEGGDDIVSTGIGNDTLIGGTGNDTLQGGNGNDTYIFNRGDGSDTISDTSGTDTLQFGDGITVNDLIVHAEGNNLIVALKEDGKTFSELTNKMMLKDWFNANNMIEQLRFSDGTTLDKSAIMAMQSINDEDNYLHYVTDTVNVHAQGGNDTVVSGIGNDTLYGDAGNDTLYGNAGADTLVGGQGIDTLSGGTGDDTYLLSRGDGIDTIIEEGGIDTLRFGDGITIEDVIAQVSGNNLILALKEEGKTFDQLSDKIILNGWYNTDSWNVNNRFENITFSDGTVLNSSNAIIGLMSTDGNDIIRGNSESTTIMAGNGNDTVITGVYDTVAFGQEGDDTISASYGNDTLIGGVGNDTLLGSDGNDTYIFNRGDGSDLIDDSYIYYANVHGSAGSDTLKFGEGITQNDLIIKVSSNNNDLIIALAEEGKTFLELTDTITMKNWFNVTDRIENIAFSDGSTIATSSLIPLQGTDGDDTTHLLDTTSSVTLDLKEGNDILTTGSGNDTLIGGKGKDILNGGLGNDTYIFNRGDGQDRVTDAGGNDTLAFGEGISHNDITARVVGMDLIIGLNEAGVPFDNLENKITLVNWYQVSNRIENFRFSDGSVLGAEIAAQFVGTDGDDVISGSKNDEIIMGLNGNDTITALGGNDMLIGGQGDDTLKGGTGNDTYIFNRGDGQDQIIEGNLNNSVKFHGGSDQLSTTKIVTTAVTGQQVSVSLDMTWDGTNLVMPIGFYGYDLFFSGKTFGFNTGNSDLYGIGNNTFLIGSSHTITAVFTQGDVTKNKLFIDGVEQVLSQQIGTPLSSRADITQELNISGWDINTPYRFSGSIDNVQLHNRALSASEAASIAKGDTIQNGLVAQYDFEGATPYSDKSGNGHNIIVMGSPSIIQTIGTTTDSDTLQFSSSITANDLIVKVSNNDLIVALKEEGVVFDDLSDQIVLKDWFSSGKRVEEFIFSDGTILEYQGILDLDGVDETLYGTPNNDVINGYGGDDILIGQAGNDTLDGGMGDDSLQGGSGDDTYLFGRGGGKDVINDVHESGGWYGGYDTLKFKEGIAPGDLLIKQIGHDLVVALKEEGKTFDELSDKVTITNWSYNDPSVPESWNSYNDRFGVETFTFPDGTAWNTTDIITHLGTEDDDVIYGLDGNDTLSGGKGNDVLYGRGGDDTYIFNRGDGQDTIYDEGQYDYYGDNDQIRLGNGISANDVILHKDGLNLVIALKEDSVEFDALADKITIQNWFNLNTRIEHLLLSDGSEIDLSYLLNPSEDNDNLIYGSDNDVIDALGGDDIVYANGGNDTIIGGKENDELHGGYGNDIYVFNRGDGQDTIYDDDYSSASNSNVDTIRFGEGITQEDLIVSTDWFGWDRQARVLTIGLKEDGVNFEDLHDTINICNWDYQTIEHIEFSDGTILSLDDIIALQSTDQNDMVIGTNYDDILNGNAGDDTLHGFYGNDTLTGGIGDDMFYGGYGNDTYVFNRGDGQDTIYDYGSNSYYGGEGVISNTLEDVLEFGDNITINDIVVEIQDGDLLIGIQEPNKTFDELNDMIRISNWESNYYQNGVETIRLSDGSTYNIAEYFNLSHNENYYGGEGPIVFDLNSNGITSTSSDSNTVYFDYNADGLRERTGWSERGDGLLVADVNHDGIINDGSELFGNHTKLFDGSLAKDGYEAMRQYDRNNDGKIDSSDAHFNDLLLWKDTNLDGQSSTDELSTLSANGIVSIDLTANPVNVGENGNTISYETHYTDTTGTDGLVRDLWFKTVSADTIASQSGEIADAGSFSDSFDNFTTDTTLEIDSIKSFTDSGIDSLTLQSRYTGSGLDGASAQTVFEGVGYTGTLSNVWLKSDTLDTQYTYNGTLSDDVKALPNIAGQGNVIGLQEAMNEKSDLAQSVTAFQSLSESGNLADFEANIDAIIEGWALYDLSGKSANATPPIVLDLDHDGVTSISLGASNAYFDYDGDGRREHTAWADEGDALLSIDLDGDGVVTHGAELFGNYTLKADGTKATDGYDAMAQYDTNGDNVLDASDAEFSKLRLWKDLNQNGKNDSGELSTLAEAGISAINLSRTDGTTFTQITEEGNSITNETNYTGVSDGTVRDVWFSYDGTDTIAYSDLSDSDEKKIAIVENFYGRRLNSEERNSVEVIAEVLNQYNALRYDTIAKIITNKLYGEGFPNCQFLHDALNNTLGRVVGGTASTTETLLTVNLLAALLKREHVGVIADIYPEYFSNPTIAGLLAQSNIAIGFEEGALIGHIGNRYFGTSLAESLDFSSLDGVRAYMSGGDDTILGSHGIDELVGGEGNDTLNGNGGNDVFEGGQGDDTLIGSSTQNVYRYAWGDGNDTIIDAGSEEYAPDTLRFTNLDISRVSIERVNDDMVIHVRDEEGALLTPFDEPFGTITIKNGYTSGRIEHFYFGNTRYTMEEVLAYVPADSDYYFVRGDAHVTIDEKGGEDTLHFGDGISKENIIARIVGNDLVIGLAQDGRTFDTLSDKITILNYTGAIENFTFQDGTTMSLDAMTEFAMEHLMISGSDSSETLYGGSEGEIFNAGVGDDTIYGEAGDDTYKFGLGDGHDTIIDTAGKDTILLKEGVLASETTLSLDGDDLIVSLNDGSSVRVVSWITSDGRIEQIKDSQGNSVDFSAVLKPVVENTTVEGNEDTPLEGLLSVSDISGTPLTYAIATDAQHGTVELNKQTGEWTYVPNANFNGNDTVIISVTNGYGVTSNSTITLNLASVNDTPSIEGEDIAVTLRNALSTEGQIVAHDIDGDTLSYVIKSQASHGELNVDDNGKWIYTTTDGYDGADSAVISVSDGNGGRIDKILNFTIIDNTVPEAPSEINNTLQDIRILTGEVGATDVDNDTLSYTVSTEASHGIFSVNEAGEWSYMASDGYMGSDSAIISIDDGNGGISTQTLNFDVKVSAPTFSDSTSNLFEDTNATGVLNVTNPVGGVLTYEVLASSTKGSFSMNETGEWNYSPTANLNGEDSVTIKVTNTYGLSTTATLNLAIEAVNDAPITSSEESFVLQDIRTINSTLEAIDVDGDILEYTIKTQPLHGEMSLNAKGEWSYTPVCLYIGSDSAIVTVSDSHGGIVEKTMVFDTLVSAPSFENRQLSLSEDSMIGENLSVINPIGGSLLYEVVNSTSNGHIVLSDEGGFIYTPNSNYHGNDEVTIKVSNEYGLSTTRTITFDIISVNDTPDAPTETTHTLQDIRILSGEIGATDPDGDTLTYTVSSAAAHGTISIDANGVWNYSADNGYMGSDSAIISIDDGNGGIITQTLNFDVKVSVPTLVDRTSNLLEDSLSTGTLDVLNPIGGTLVYEVINASSKGSFSVNEAGEWNYTPNADLNGDDSVILKVTNEYGLSTTATLSLAIEAVNDAPNVIGTAHLAAVNEDSGTITITAEQLLSNASDVDGDTLSIKNLTASSGTLIDNHDGTWSLIPSSNFNGTITLNYSVSDTQIDTAAIATQYLVPVNDKPVIDANNQHFLLENTRTIGGTIAASDVDGDTLAYSVTTQAAHGVVSVDSYGNWSYKADGSFNGEDSAIVTIDDGHGGQVTSVLNFTVKGYLYEGKDLIINDNGTDTLVMTTVNQEDMTFSRNGNDLAIRVNNGSTVTLKNFFTDTAAGVQTIATSQGNITLTRDAINNSQYGGYSASDSNDHLIIGDDNSNWLIGNGGDDIIVAGSGYDYVNGGDGNDLLIGGSNADNLFGGNGNDMIYADDGSDSVYAGAGNDVLFGGNGDDTVFADDGNDTISGGAGNDTIYAGTGNDTIKGGAGNDFINGDTGSDTYLFNIGDGNDTIVDTSSYGSSDKDILVFGAGITKDNLQIIRDNYDLVLKVNDNDSVRIQYWFGSDQRNTLESIVFADKTTLTTDQINNLAIVKGSAGSDWISGIDYMNDHIYGFAGNDGLYGYGGNDILDGGDGNDIVDGGAGNDTLIGGKGADSLNGGSGSDTYSFSIGDGADTITDWSQYGSNDMDSITFGAGITKNDVRFMMKNGNLLIGYAQNDTINVQYAQNTQAQIEKFTLCDGNYLTSNDLNVIIQSMNAYATDHGISITSLDTVKNNQALMNIVAAGWHQ